MRAAISLLVCLLAACPAFAADYYVDNAIGKDTHDGKSKQAPFHTINQAIGVAAPGDTIHLVPTGRLYRQSAVFMNKGGLPGKPITLDGHGATLSGADPCPAEGWKPWKEGVLMRDDMTSNVFLLVDGEMVFGRMARDALEPGEFCYEWDRIYYYPPKGKTPEIVVGQPGGAQVTLDPKRWQRSHSKIGAVRRYQGLKRPEWIKVDGAPVALLTAKERLEPGTWCVEGKVLYYRPPAGRRVEDLAIECVRRGNGVQMGGKFGYVIVRNLTATHVYNDGYNIHNAVTHVEFYNCNAHHCGDEGFSAHDACGTLLDGAVYEYCDNGIANVNNAGYSITRNVILTNARSVGFLIQSSGTARHELTNAILIDNPTQISAADLKADNVLLVKLPASPARYGDALGCGRNVQLTHVTALGNPLPFRAGKGSQVAIRDSVFASGQGAPHVRADAPYAVLKLENVLFGDKLAFEWGSRYPWKKMPIAEWLPKAAQAGVAKDCRTGDTSFLAPLLKGAMPARLPDGLGCDKALVQKYCDFLAKKRENAQ